MRKLIAFTTLTFALGVGVAFADPDGEDVGSNGDHWGSVAVVGAAGPGGCCGDGPNGGSNYGRGSGGVSFDTQDFHGARGVDVQNGVNPPGKE